MTSPRATAPAASRPLPLVLIVDDEPQIIDSIAVMMRREFHIIGARSGQEGLELLQTHPDIEVVVSDMRMPAMDGATFLAEVRRRHPQVVRMLLTGQTDLSGAIKAVNEGQIFRFLSKPFQSHLLAGSFHAAVKHHRLAVAEQELLEQTLRGCVQVLTDVLALAHPIAFGRATRLKKHAMRLAARLDVGVGWEFEMAALLSQLGWIAVPTEVIDKVFAGAPLTVAEEKMVHEVPGLAHGLLHQLPRIGPVLDILSGLTARSHRPARIPTPAKILRVVDDFDRLRVAGTAGLAVCAQMARRESRYDQAVLEALREEVRETEDGRRDVVVRELPISALEAGMVLAYDVCMKNGSVFVARGFEITESFLHRAKNLREGTLIEPVCVIEGSEV